MKSGGPIVVSYGAGTNSTALLVGLVNRSERPDLILFSDTGGKRPDTYAYIHTLNTYLAINGFPQIETICLAGPTIEEDCAKKGTMPSVAFGFKTCSHRWKIEPQEKRLNSFPQARAAWRRGELVTKLIGFDAGEPQRAKPFKDEKCVNRYPLIEWGWDRDDCIEAIRKAGLPLPGKSSCFFCPNMKAFEIKALSIENPDLYARALEMQDTAIANKKIGRVKHWKQIGDQLGLDMPCGCYDGGEE